MSEPWIGATGQLVQLPCEASEGTSFTDRYTTGMTVEGIRRAQGVRYQMRSWDVSIDAAGQRRLGILDQFYAGDFGNGPWHWIPTDAAYGNLLTPREAMLRDLTLPSGVTESGPMDAADGTRAAHSITFNLSGTAAIYVRDIPVIAGYPVTYSVDLIRSAGTPGLTIGFYRADGTSAGVSVTNGRPVDGAQRVTLTTTVPEGAVTMGIGANNDVYRLIRPQVTWSNRETPWTSGRGCRSAILDGLSFDLAYRDAHKGLYSSASFTVLEVA